MKSTPICMPHHSGGDNATKVRRRKTCRNSFRDIFLHDPFAHHLEHALKFQVIPKNTREKKIPQFGFRAFCNSSPQALECPTQTVREADSSATFRRRLKPHPFSDWLSFSVSAGLTLHRNFSMSSQDFFLCFYVVFLLKKKSPSAYSVLKTMDPSAK